MSSEILFSERYSLNIFIKYTSFHYTEFQELELTFTGESCYIGIKNILVEVMIHLTEAELCLTLGLVI